MCPQNTGNAVSETQNSKNVQRSMSPEPPTIVSSLCPPLNKILAYFSSFHQLLLNKIKHPYNIDIRRHSLFK